MSKPAQEVWNNKTQTFHGGQDWKFCDNYVADFSVTTNGLGTPPLAVEAARNALKDIHHYPAADMEPAKTELAKWMAGDSQDWEDLHARLLLGNGASELIDLVTRHAPEGAWKGGSISVQYKEYERAAKAMGREILDSEADKELVGITAIINPNNPTGQWRDLPELQKYIVERCRKNSAVIIDESMQLWFGPEWRGHSLLAAKEWIDSMQRDHQISVYLMHSWTKIWSCPGIRLGSVLCPTKEIKEKIQLTQVPWSVNGPALAFLEAVVKDHDFMVQTWETNNAWRKMTADLLAERFPEWKVYGETWLSWLWVDVGSEDVQKRVVEVCKANGTPCRSGTPGYQMKTFVRFAVRKPEEIQHFFKGLERL